MIRRIIILLTFIVISDMASAQYQFGPRRTSAVAVEPLEVDYSKPPVEYEIADIQVVGAETLDVNAIISLSGLKIGDRINIPGEATSSAIRKLMRSGIISDITIHLTKVEGDLAYLTIELHERPRLTRFEFKGIGKTHQTELSDKLKLIKGRVLTDAVVKNTEQAVKSYFVEKGFLNTKVKVERIRDTLMTNGVKMNIVVDRNERVNINRINIIGNEVIEDQRIKKKMKKTNEHIRLAVIRDVFNGIMGLTPNKVINFFSQRQDLSGSDLKAYLNDNIKVNFFQSSKFVRDEYKADKERIIDFYNSKGYRDAAIVRDTVYHHDENSINIDLVIDEGTKYYFRDIIWTGNYVYPDTLLSQVLGVEKGDVYNLELVHKKLSFDPQGTDIQGLYMNNGYLFFNITPVEVRIENDSIDLEMRIFEGGQATVRNVIVRGNDRTHDHVIYRELRTLPGQKFSRNDLIRTQRELAQMGYFDPEQIGINPIPDQMDETVDIEYTLVEKSSDQIELSGGWGGYYGFIGTLGVVFNNFSLKNIPKLQNWRPLPTGDGQKLAVRFQANGRAYKNVSLSFTEPWLGGRKPNALTVGINRSSQRPYDNRYYRQMINLYPEVYGNMDPDASFELSGASISLGRRLQWPDDWFTLSNSLSFNRYSLNKYPIAANLNDGVYNNLAFTTTIARNSIDNPMYPRAGSSLALSISLTPPYSVMSERNYGEMSLVDRFRRVEYHKWMFDAKHYVRIAGNLVLEAKAHMGFLGSYGGLGVGPFERFVMGGSGMSGMTSQWVLGQDVISMRGYSDDLRADITPTDKNGIRGGTIYNKIGLELRFPVTMQQATTIYLLSFFEAGNNWSSFDEYNPFNMFRTVGVGARVFMPAFGMLGIDWGVPLDNKIGNLKPEHQRFQFTFGHQIR
jgi:outer membrane protein insertion porin family